jgi:hypothetical protein
MSNIDRLLCTFMLSLSIFYGLREVGYIMANYAETIYSIQLREVRRSHGIELSPRPPEHPLSK